MEHLLLFERFESDALSRIFGYLKKLGNKSDKLFPDALKRVMNIYQFPIDKISDSNIEYTNRLNALKISIPDDEKINGFGVKYIKFWFSTKDGFMGFSGVGNQRMNFDTFLKGSVNPKKTFGVNELEYIRIKYNTPTGILIPVNDYNVLKDGDDSFIITGTNLTKAKIHISARGDIYAIQNVSSGGYDADSNEWKKWGKHSWGLGTVRSLNTDHSKLHLYYEDDKPLRVQTSLDKIEKSYFDFNLPINSSGKIGLWGTCKWSIIDYKSIENSDFAIVLNLEDLLKSNFEPRRDTHKKRTDLREGSLKLTPESKIKQINLDRYINYVAHRMGVKEDITEFNNLQKIIIKIFCDDFSLISMIKNKPSIDYLTAFIGKLKVLITTGNEQDKKYCLEDALYYYRAISNESKKFKSVYQDTYQKIKKLEEVDPTLLKIIEIILKIGKRIKNYLSSINIQTIEDLKITLHLIDSIRSFINDSDYKLSDTLKLMIMDFNIPTNVIMRCELSKRDEFKFTQDLTKIKNIQKYVNHLLK